MPNFKLTIEYEGTRYSGWQVQKGEKTIQGCFFDACRNLFGNERFDFFGAGRTDGGVHAFAQVAHLNVNTTLSPNQIRMGINDQLPYDVNVIRIEKADPDFHARHDATARSYLYLISKRRSAFGKNYTWWVKDKLDTLKMNEAAKILTGFRDYFSFTDPDAETGSTKVEVFWVDIHDTSEMIAIHIAGSHFLWKMVRRLVGTMVETGRGKLSAVEIMQFFKQYSSIPAKLTAPPSGLYLERVYYGNQNPERGIKIVPQILTLR